MSEESKRNKQSGSVTTHGKWRNLLLVGALVLGMLVGGGIVYALTKPGSQQEATQETEVGQPLYNEEVDELADEDLKARIENAEKAYALPANKDLGYDARLAEYYYAAGNTQKALEYLDKAITRVKSDPRTEAQAGHFETIKQAISEGKDPVW